MVSSIPLIWKDTGLSARSHFGKGREGHIKI